MRTIFIGGPQHGIVKDWPEGKCPTLFKVRKYNEYDYIADHAKEPEFIEYDYKLKIYIYTKWPSPVYAHQLLELPNEEALRLIKEHLGKQSCQELASDQSRQVTIDLEELDKQVCTRLEDFQVAKEENQVPRIILREII